MYRSRLTLPLFLAVLFAPGVRGDDASEEPTPIALADLKPEMPVVFDRDIYPIFESKCTTCHDAEGGLAEGDLDLLTVEAIVKGGKHGPGIVPEKGDESLVFLRAGHRQKPIMPPKDEGEDLTPEELMLLKLWIDQGAKPGENVTPASAKKLEVMFSELNANLQAVNTLAFGPDAKWLVAGRSNNVLVIDTATGDIKATLHGMHDLVQSVAVSPDGRTIAAGGFEKVDVWSRPEGDDLASWSGPKELKPIKDRALAVAFSPDGARIAVGAGVPSASGEVTVWDVASGEQVWSKPELHSDTVYSVAFSPDGSMIASAGADKFLRVTKAADGEPLKSFEGHTGHLLSVAWKKDGKLIATASADHTVKIWNFESGEQQRTIGGHGNEVTAVRYIGETDQLVTSCGDHVGRVINGADGKVLRVLEGGGDYLLSMTVSTDGTLAASGSQNGEIYVWNIADGARRLTVPAPTPAVASQQK